MTPQEYTQYQTEWLEQTGVAVGSRVMLIDPCEDYRTSTLPYSEGVPSDHVGKEYTVARILPDHIVITSDNLVAFNVPFSGLIALGTTNPLPIVNVPSNNYGNGVGGDLSFESYAHILLANRYGNDATSYIKLYETYSAYWLVEPYSYTTRGNIAKLERGKPFGAWSTRIDNKIKNYLADKRRIKQRELDAQALNNSLLTMTKEVRSRYTRTGTPIEQTVKLSGDLNALHIEIEKQYGATLAECKVNRDGTISEPWRHERINTITEAQEFIKDFKPRRDKTLKLAQRIQRELPAEFFINTQQQETDE